VNLLLKSLAERDLRITLLTFHEGEEVSYPNVTILRVPSLPGLSGIRPGFSFKKLICDGLMIFSLLGIMLRDRPQVVHAVEESVFMGRFTKLLFRVPYVYDMDSSIAHQLVEAKPYLRAAAGFFQWMEAGAIRHALAVVPVCQALADIAERHRQDHIMLLPDISLLSGEPPISLHLRRDLGIDDDATCFMYIGNLEAYQGIDLLLESFAMTVRKAPSARLIVVGGAPAQVDAYRRKTEQLGIEESAHLIGPRPSSEMAGLFAEADVLVSPRCQGDNTPMKIYSYLDSDKAVLATDLPTHTQVLDEQVAALAPPETAPFSAAMTDLVRDRDRRARLAARAKRLVQERYSFDAFKRRVNEIYDEVETLLTS
jgi:glycosyltransferase involved in cell wall biosynthesis